jgi:glutamate--cysteine ligase
MMKGTSSVQANFDFEDEADCARKVRAAAGVSPLITALFSNSPLLENRPSGFLSYRGHIWTRTDPARTGFPLREAYSHERWVDYLLDVPMMFYKRDNAWLPAHGATFRTFMERGLDGHFPSDKDWALHQTSVFPEVRIKHTIEVRGADCVAPDLAVGFCALLTGLLYDEAALDAHLAGCPACAGNHVGHTPVSLSGCRSPLKLNSRPSGSIPRPMYVGGVASRLNTMNELTSPSSPNSSCSNTYVS